VIHRYRVYYKFDGPTKADPMCTQKNEEQISDALDRVSLELSVYLDDDDAKITTSLEGGNAITIDCRNDSDRRLSQSVSGALICLHQKWHESPRSTAR
jgi:hypothetical protein